MSQIRNGRLSLLWLAAAKPGGRPRTTSLRDVVNAIFYVSRGGVAWRMLPRDFPAYQTTYRYFRAWSNDGTWEKVHEALRKRVRQKEGREASPSAAIIDSQSAKTTEKGAPEGTTRARNQRARAAYPRRHAVILECEVHPADIQDRDGGKLLLEKLGDRFPRLQRIWADGAYAGKLVDWAKDLGHWVLAIVKRTDDMWASKFYHIAGSSREPSHGLAGFDG
jgi:putative transposase